MRHITLTCKHHPLLRWSTKAIAWSGDKNQGHYNGSRNIFFLGTLPDLNPNVFECSCPSHELVIAPEENMKDLGL